MSGVGVGGSYSVGGRPHPLAKLRVGHGVAVGVRRHPGRVVRALDLHLRGGLPAAFGALGRFFGSLLLIVLLCCLLSSFLLAEDAAPQSPLQPRSKAPTGSPSPLRPASDSEKLREQNPTPTPRNSESDSEKLRETPRAFRPRSQARVGKGSRDRGPGVRKTRWRNPDDKQTV